MQLFLWWIFVVFDKHRMNILCGTDDVWHNDIQSHKYFIGPGITSEWHQIWSRQYSNGNVMSMVTRMRPHGSKSDQILDLHRWTELLREFSKLCWENVAWICPRLTLQTEDQWILLKQEGWGVNFYYIVQQGLNDKYSLFLGSLNDGMVSFLEVICQLLMLYWGLTQLWDIWHKTLRLFNLQYLPSPLEANVRLFRKN